MEKYGDGVLKIFGRWKRWRCKKMEMGHCHNLEDEKYGDGILLVFRRWEKIEVTLYLIHINNIITDLLLLLVLFRGELCHGDFVWFGHVKQLCFNNPLKVPTLQCLSSVLWIPCTGLAAPKVFLGYPFLVNLDIVGWTSQYGQTFIIANPKSESLRWW